MRYLYIDTSSSYLYTAIVENEKLLSEIKEEFGQSLSEVALPKIASMFEKTNLEAKDINKIIVVDGPGSFTGERIAVTIGKTISYCLNIPIRVIDALTINAININSEVKITALEDRTGAYVGKFDANNKPLEQFQYMNKTLYNEFKDNNDVVVDVNIDYEKVYEYIMTLESLNPHEVKPLYIKGISALNDK